MRDWEQFLDRNKKCFHLDASGESLYGIYKKMKYLDGNVPRISNVLLILDYSTLSRVEPRTGHLTMTAPQLENGQNFIAFQLKFLKTFFRPQFLYAFIDLKLFGQVRDYMKSHALIDDNPLNYDVSTNEIRFTTFEALMAKDENLYYKPRKHLFYVRSGKVKYSPVCIGDKQKDYLNEIRSIFIKHKTNYKVVISPLYDQIELNKADFEYLCDLFGKDNVFNFSGINEFTNDYRNYYETSHYRPHVARKIMQKVYDNQN